MLSASPDDQRPIYIAFFSCFVSLFGAFLGVLSGGAVLDWLQALYGAGRTFLGHQPDRYKLVVVLSVAMRLGIVLLFLPMLTNAKGISVRGMLKGLFIKQ